MPDPKDSRRTSQLICCRSFEDSETQRPLPSLPVYRLSRTATGTLLPVRQAETKRQPLPESLPGIWDGNFGTCLLTSWLLDLCRGWNTCSRRCMQNQADKWSLSCFRYPPQLGWWVGWKDDITFAKIIYRVKKWWCHGPSMWAWWRLAMIWSDIVFK